MREVQYVRLGRRPWCKRFTSAYRRERRLGLHWFTAFIEAWLSAR